MKGKRKNTPCRRLFSHGKPAIAPAYYREIRHLPAPASLVCPPQKWRFASPAPRLRADNRRSIHIHKTPYSHACLQPPPLSGLAGPRNCPAFCCSAFRRACGCGPDSHHRGLPARRRGRCHGAAAGRPACPAPGRQCRGGKQGWRGRRHRAGRHSQGRA